MKKILKIMALSMAMVLVVMSFTACGADEKAIKKVIVAYSKASQELDFETAKKLLDPKSEQYEELSENSTEAFSSLENMGLKEDDLKRVIRDYAKYVDIEVNDIVVTDITAVAQLKTMIPDMDSIDSDVMNEYMESKKLSQTDLMSKYSSQEELAKLMLDMVEWMVKEKVPHLEKTTQTQQISLKKINGSWLITQISEAE